ncbi:hypothetical protein [Frigoriglobus tundricola]|uniref:Uncharacterized protein n=1 Tax=Frigoriglobus tundricola TaxID=2774151 RepID=A0A6M5YPM6_9BACT|nr:hypothetical protein [Frigoriglobus tundricola]QJW95370.1 hypothetical protein FTUN_2919 [Frigoriglobus tundricola]
MGKPTAALAHHPFALDQDIAEGMALWCLKRQSCQFGRIAAKKGQIHFCILHERDLADGDKGLAEKIAKGKRLWKQRALVNMQSPPSGMMLLFASPRVTLAAPDDNLRRFADRLLELAGWAPQRRGKKLDNAISSDFLYLKNPADGFAYGFQFNVDFFAASGDGRWWHDHRIPGGIAFTANSAGHMRHFKDWYESPATDHGQWAVKQAMITVSQAHPTKGEGTEAAPKSPQDEGRVTWLRPLDGRGKPLVNESPCPLNPVPAALQWKDWTRYEGLLHTDHAVRAEFFDGREEAATGAAPYLMDLTYLYDRRQADFINFMAGFRISDDAVYQETGRPETWMTRDGEQTKPHRTDAQVGEMNALLRKCYGWPKLPSLTDDVS